MSRAKIITETLRDIIGVNFNGQRVEDYIQSELEDFALTILLGESDEQSDEEEK